MTMLVGINFGDYVLIAADKGATLCGKLLLKNEEKIKKINEDIYITGSGFTPLLTYVKESLKVENIDKIEDIIEIINNKKEYYLNNQKYNLDTYMEEINTSFLFTYRNRNKNKNELSIGLHHPARYIKEYNQDKKNIIIINENDFDFSLPEYKDTNIVKNIHKIVKDAINNKRNKKEELNMLSYIFFEMSKNSEHMTATFDYIFIDK